MSISHFDDPTPTGRPSQLGEPTWELTTFFPRQGEWSEGEYLALESRGGRLVELVDGKLEVLPMPTFSHQFILAYLHDQLRAYVTSRQLGLVAFAPCPIRLARKHFREPDVFYAGHARIRDLHTPPDGVDLAMEIVSPGEKDRHRDLVEKRIDYAQAGIPEYWIVDPLEKKITVLVLEGAEYRALGEYQPGQTARSKLLEGLEIDVAAAFAAGEPQQPAN